MRNDVQRRRLAQGWSQAHLGAAAGVSRQTIIAIENGRYDPSLPLAFRLAGIFNCRLEELFFPEPDATAGAASRNSNA